MRYLFTALLFFTLWSCTEPLPEINKTLNTSTLVPLPVEVVEGEGFAFSINPETQITYGDADLLAQAEILAEEIKMVSGYDLSVSEGVPGQNTIHLSLDGLSASDSPEAYQLNSSQMQLNLTANAPAGMYYAVQTLRQLLPVEIKEGQPKDTLMAIGAGMITDYPRYGYRGSMLDVARHFFGVEDVKRYIDYLAAFKMNVLHLHLSDDQGWRIEIKSWPKLTEIGGSTEVGGGEGGFYTQEEYKEIIQYAADRHIMVIPEIDMPGHTNAALASYPELNCDGKATELYTGTQVGFSTLCTDKEIVYQFVDDVFRELAALTPGPYLHIGGDESHVTAKPDYIKFVTRVQEIVASHGKQLVGWDEVVTAELNNDAIAQYWSSPENANMAADKNLKVIISPAKYAYLDMKYDTTTKLGLSWAGTIEVDEGYQWDPAELEEKLTDDNILGVAAPLWGETIETLDDIEYLLFPRIIGYAEIGWTPAAQRDWTDYRERLAAQQAWLDRQGINYYRSPKVPWDANKMQN
jgi:hexosaminidase